MTTSVCRWTSRNCANLLRRSVAEAWDSAEPLLRSQFARTRSAASVQAHERLIAELSGLDVIVLGLGQNGHLGFNEPGSAENSGGRVLDLDAISIEANRRWFGGDYAPARGVTVGLKTILAARRILALAYGAHKTDAVKALCEGPIHDRCPGSFLQKHPNTHLFLDEAATAGLTKNRLGKVR
jgi:glucosamine-6-phosphate deaminase